MLFGVKLTEMRKALYPSIVVVVGVVTHGLATGEWNNIELALGTVGVVHAFLVFWTTNVPGLAHLKEFVPLTVNLLIVLSMGIASGTFNREELVAAGAAILLAIISGTTENGGRTNSLHSLPQNVGTGPITSHPPA